MFLRCPKCLFCYEHTETRCHKCNAELPPVRVEDFFGNAAKRLLAAEADLIDSLATLEVSGDYAEKELLLGFMKRLEALRDSMANAQVESSEGCEAE